MSKKIKLGADHIETMAVEYDGKTYNVPLAKTMKRKELLALKTEEDVFEMFAKYIPAEVLDNMTMGEYKQLSDAWAEANDDASLGES